MEARGVRGQGIFRYYDAAIPRAATAFVAALYEKINIPGASDDSDRVYEGPIVSST